MNQKKKLDLISCLRSQLKMCNERLNDNSFSETWDQLYLDKQKIENTISTLKDE